jgi:cell wall-associated NlpC family hydrolase
VAAHHRIILPVRNGRTIPAPEVDDVSGTLLRLVCTVAVTAGAALALAPAPSVAVPEPGAPPAAKAPESGDRSVAGLLTEFQRLYREAEKATAAHNTTEEELDRQRAEVTRIDRRLARARLSLDASRSDAGRLARQQYQSHTGISPYVRLLLARDPQHALDQGHVIRQVALERAETVERLVRDEARADMLARRARKALDDRLVLAERRRNQQDVVRERLQEAEELLASLSDRQLARIAELEKEQKTGARREPGASGTVSAVQQPTRRGASALRYAVEQIGKPYEWGAEGPDAYDCSGLTSRAWLHAGLPIPRTSQEQWERLEHVPLEGLRPGDLVVYFPEATHVALYLGNGLVVQAARPGTKIKVSPIAANPVLGAVRPDPLGRPLARYTPPELPEGARDGDDGGYASASAPVSEAR